MGSDCRDARPTSLEHAESVTPVEPKEPPAQMPPKSHAIGVGFKAYSLIEGFQRLWVINNILDYARRRGLCVRLLSLDGAHYSYSFYTPIVDTKKSSVLLQ